jgi:23S rRNA pseudouridine1911/1915/1917 synthase
LDLIFPHPHQSIHPEIMSLSILYEDNDLIVLNKPVGQVVHPVRNYQNGTLANGLIAHWQQTGENSATFHPVHRLDRLTSGLVLIAKSPWAHQQMALQLANNQMRRLYSAVCKGIPSRSTGKITLPVQRFNSQNKATSIETEEFFPGVKWIVYPGGKPCATRYRVLQTSKEASLIAVKLLTGRTHQIRTHFSHLGFPLWGDSLYGNPGPEINRPALHAVRLTFNHPCTFKKIKLEAEIPSDFHRLLVELRFNKFQTNKGVIFDDN